ncbi:MAG: Crp/Fnr family transcriptional regulator [Cyclobacteriaceae bacterium]|nr:Crp/Fnr family transcriptional regulator [Cyclobacteriaceae bacterium]
MQDKPVNYQCTYCKSRGNSMFGSLGEEDLEKLNHNKSCIRYKKGQTLFYEGTRPMGLFCVNTGKVKVFKLSSQGKEQIINIAKPGDFLGYRAILSEEFYSASATVIEDAAICFIPKEDFLGLLSSNPDFFQRIIKNICHELGVMRERISDLAQKSVRERLAGSLLMLKETYGVDGEKSTLIDIQLSREDLANIVGTATETVIRLLSEFKKDGLISLDGKKIKVLKPRELAKEADFYG